MSTETELIKERLDVADVIGEYLPLKRVGQHWKGLCPFHNEKTPSFIVSPHRGMWHCFGCNEHGDVFTFVQRVEGLDFPAALKLLAARAGVTLADAPSSTDSRTRLFEGISLAAQFYHAVLRQRAGDRARQYLTERGVTDAAIQEFQLGYAPHQWQTLTQALARKGFTPAELAAAGLVITRDDGTMYDRFRGRLMFPIHDLQGRIVAFGGRIVPWHATGDEGKYINSSETAIYQKRRTIYNLHRAKAAIRQQQTALVVEGYMDVVMLVQSKVANVVASSGTAFTPEQIAQLQRFTPAIHFAFDADPAGRHAAIAATQAALSAGLRVATVVFPGGKDAADVALQSPESIAPAVQHPRSLVSILLEQFKTTGSPAEREQALHDLLPLLRAVSNPVHQGEMIQEVAELLHVPEVSILTAVQKQASPPPASSLGPASPPTATPDDTLPAAITPDQQLLGLLIIEAPVRSALWPRLQEEDIADPAAQRLYAALQPLAADTGQFAALDAEALVGRLPPGELSLAEALRGLIIAARATSADTPLQEGEKLLRLLQRRRLETKIRTLQQQLATGELSATPDALEHFQTLLRELTQVTA